MREPVLSRIYPKPPGHPTSVTHGSCEATTIGLVVLLRFQVSGKVVADASHVPHTR